MLTTEILRFESLPSTNLEAARRASEGAPEGLCIVAGEQTAGRGRLERHWVSPKHAGLYFSIVLRPQFEQSVWPLLTLMAAVAVRDALLDVYELDTDIKWPNDLLVNDRKLCGILAETVDTRMGRAVVLGIGINLKQGSFPVELDGIATSVESANGRTADLEMVIEPLVASIVRYYEVLQLPDGPEMIVREWSARSSYANGKRIRIANGDEILEGTSRGLEHDGGLRIEMDSGQIKTVRAGDVTAVRRSV
jgi:BirA family transcriptional regulator, biotin operon repressor / biotin---[acetyl-CoA-carboxylase] ligase